ncbi:hypothetical protein G7046_g7715 [Stylonectria norvegica]|nr:hypothetical protein G7046_g7715 [Stylonectria norvegica]
MPSIQNILLAIAVLAAAPLSLAGPTVPGNNAVAQFEQRDVAIDHTPYEKRDEDKSIAVKEGDDEDEDLDDEEVVDDDEEDYDHEDDEEEEEEDNDEQDAVESKLSGRDIVCRTTSRKHHNCHTGQCKPSQCKLSITRRCVWKKSKHQRPSGCSECRCYKSSI